MGVRRWVFSAWSDRRLQWWNVAHRARPNARLSRRACICRMCLRQGFAAIRTVRGPTPVEVFLRAWPRSDYLKLHPRGERIEARTALTISQRFSSAGPRSGLGHRSCSIGRFHRRTDQVARGLIGCRPADEQKYPSDPASRDLPEMYQSPGSLLVGVPLMQGPIIGRPSDLDREPISRLCRGCTPSYNG